MAPISSQRFCPGMGDLTLLSAQSVSAAAHPLAACGPASSCCAEQSHRQPAKAKNSSEDSAEIWRLPCAPLLLRECQQQQLTGCA